MSLRSIAAATYFVVLGLTACSDSSEEGGAARWGTLLIGTVVDVTGEPIANAQVIADDGRIAASYSDGTFRLRYDIMSGTILLRIRASGYSTGIKVIALNGMPELMVSVILGPAPERFVFSTADGVVVRTTSSRGEVIGLSIPQNAMVDAQGLPASGEAVIDIAEYNAQTAPGEFVGLTANGDSVPLLSYGMWEITASTDDGRPLYLRSDSGATLELGSPCESAGDASLWALDESIGQWVEDPGGQSVDMGGGLMGLTTWLVLPKYFNLDKPYQKGCVCGYVIDALGEATCGYEVYAESVNWYGFLGSRNSDYTDIYGKYCVEGMRTGTVEISVVGHRNDSIEVVIPDVEASADLPASCGQGPNFFIPLEAATVCPVCGDGICHAGEGPPECPEDCEGSLCGNGNCDPDESFDTCPDDCTIDHCGDGFCDADENLNNCYEDCIETCGDGVCGADEDPEICPADCAASCGNGICDSSEDFFSCPADCDDICESDEAVECLQTWVSCYDNYSSIWTSCTTNCESDQCSCNCGHSASSDISDCHMEVDSCILTTGISNCPGSCLDVYVACCDGTLRKDIQCAADYWQQTFIDASCN